MVGVKSSNSYLEMIETIQMDELLDWLAVSVVATSHSVLSPRFHCVLPDGFSSNLTMCGELRKLGFRRIGLVLSGGMLQQREKGIPEYPKVTLIPSAWKPAR